MARPILLVDVDGVISLFGAVQTDPAEILGTQVEGTPHLLSRRAAAQLCLLAGRYDCVWCTGWEERAEEHLPALLGLPGGWRHVSFSDPPADTAHWKLAGIDAMAGLERPVAWVDDAHDDACRGWARARPGPTLLIGTEPHVGLTEQHVETLLAWADRLRDGGR